jgi:hypothetical protein
MSILKLIASSSFITVNKDIARKLSLESAVLFGDLASAQVYWNEREQSSDVWFFRTRDTIEHETTLKKRKQLSAYRKLTDNNLIKEKISGVPAKKYYLIDDECLENLNTLLLQNETPDRCKTEQLNVAKQNDINKNKENKNKVSNKLNKKTIKKDSDFDSVPVSCSDSAPLKTETEKKKEKNSAQKRKKFTVADCVFPEVFENNPILKQTFLDFAEMRQQMKKGYKTKKGTETKLNSLAKDCIRYGIENVIGAINFSLESEYLGIFVHDYQKRQKQQHQNEKRTNNNGTQQTTSIHEDFARRVQRDLAEELRTIRNNKMQQ